MYVFHGKRALLPELNSKGNPLFTCKTCLAPTESFPIVSSKICQVSTETHLELLYLHSFLLKIDVFSWSISSPNFFDKTLAFLRSACAVSFASTTPIRRFIWTPFSPSVLETLSTGRLECCSFSLALPSLLFVASTFSGIWIWMFSRPKTCWFFDGLVFDSLPRSVAKSSLMAMLRLWVDSAIALEHKCLNSSEQNLCLVENADRCVNVFSIRGFYNV